MLTQNRFQHPLSVIMNIVSNQNGTITFKYLESNTGITRYRNSKGEDLKKIAYATCPPQRVPNSQKKIFPYIKIFRACSTTG